MDKTYTEVLYPSGVTFMPGPVTRDEAQAEIAKAMRERNIEPCTLVEDTLLGSKEPILLIEFQDYDLLDSETNEVIREATPDEALASLTCGQAEGHILVQIDGKERRCYVMEQ